MSIEDRLEQGDMSEDPTSGDYVTYAKGRITGRLVLAIVRAGGRSKQIALPRPAVRRLRDFLNDYLENTP